MKQGLCGAAYVIASQTDAGAVFSQTRSKVTFSTLNADHDNRLETRIPTTEDSALSPRYYDVVKGGKLWGILIPERTDKAKTAIVLRARFGSDTVLQFLGFPRPHEIVPRTEAAARAAIQA